VSSSALAYRAVAATGWPAARRRSRGAVFCFHNVVAEPVARADTALHMPLVRFRELLDWMTDAYRIIPLAELIGRARERAPVAGLAAITADDAYEGFIRIGLAELRSRGLHATVFVVTDAAAQPKPFWWDAAAASGKLDAASRDLAVHRWAGDGEVVGRELTLESIEAPPVLLPAPWELLRSARSPLVEYGAHTCTHVNLTKVAGDRVSWELTAARSAMESALDTKPALVSYPYGLVDATVAAAARDAGYDAGVALGSASLRPGVDPFRVPRINVPAGVTPGTLACWAVDLRWNRPA
jgi:peptidoglycan/xylan/chitin deacetylase (PgdA/CDA1 family)